MSYFFLLNLEFLQCTKNVDFNPKPMDLAFAKIDCMHFNNKVRFMCSL